MEKISRAARDTIPGERKYLELRETQYLGRENISSCERQNTWGEKISRVARDTIPGGGRVVYHTSTGQYIGVATFFFFFFLFFFLEPGLKLDKKSRMVSKVRNFRLVGLFLGVVATTLI